MRLGTGGSAEHAANGCCFRPGSERVVGRGIDARSGRHASVWPCARQTPVRFDEQVCRSSPAPRQCAAVARAAAHVARAAMRAITHVEGKAIGSSRRPRRRAARWLRRQLTSGPTGRPGADVEPSTARAVLGALLAIGVAPDRGRWRGRGGVRCRSANRAGASRWQAVATASRMVFPREEPRAVPGARRPSAAQLHGGCRVNGSEKLRNLSGGRRIAIRGAGEGLVPFGCNVWAL